MVMEVGRHRFHEIELSQIGRSLDVGQWRQKICLVSYMLILRCLCSSKGISGGKFDMWIV